MIHRASAVAFVLLLAGCSAESEPSFAPDDTLPKDRTPPSASTPPAPSSSASPSKPEAPASAPAPAPAAPSPASACAPAGMFVTDTLKVSGDQGFCDAIAKEIDKQPFEAVKLVTTKVDDQHFTASAPNDEPRSYTLDATKCELASAQPRTGTGRVTDPKGNRIDIAFSASTTMAFANDAVTITGVTEVKSTTAGATGFPCKLTSIQTAKRQ